MKSKILTGFSAIALAIVFASCSGNNNTQTATHTHEDGTEHSCCADDKASVQEEFVVEDTDSLKECDHGCKHQCPDHDHEDGHCPHHNH